MNLTYLCYGLPKVYQEAAAEKGFGQNPCISDEMPFGAKGGYRIEETDYRNAEPCPLEIKKVEKSPPFLPQILP